MKVREKKIESSQLLSLLKRYYLFNVQEVASFSSFFCSFFYFFLLSSARPALPVRYSENAFSSYNDRSSFKPALWVKRGHRCSFCHGHGSRIEPPVHYHSITTSPALSIDNVSAVLHPPFLARFPSKNFHTNRVALHSWLFFSTLGSRSHLHMDTIVLLIPWRPTKVHLLANWKYTRQHKHYLKHRSLSTNVMFHISVQCCTWIKLCNECNYFSQSLIYFNYVILDYVAQNSLNNSPALF